jgi:hypothetical protein
MAVSARQGNGGIYKYSTCGVVELRTPASDGPARRHTIGARSSSRHCPARRSRSLPTPASGRFCVFLGPFSVSNRHKGANEHVSRRFRGFVDPIDPAGPMKCHAERRSAVSLYSCACPAPGVRVAHVLLGPSRRPPHGRRPVCAALSGTASPPVPAPDRALAMTSPGSAASPSILAVHAVWRKCRGCDSDHAASRPPQFRPAALSRPCPALVV